MTPAPPVQIRIAGALVALQALAALAFAIVIGVQASSLDLPLTAVLGQTAYFAVIGLALLGVGIGLVRGRRGARTPAIVTQLLLLPVVYSSSARRRSSCWASSRVCTWPARSCC